MCSHALPTSLVQSRHTYRCLRTPIAQPQFRFSFAEGEVSRLFSNNGLLFVVGRGYLFTERVIGMVVFQSIHLLI